MGVKIGDINHLTERQEQINNDATRVMQVANINTKAEIDTLCNPNDIFL